MSSSQKKKISKSEYKQQLRALQIEQRDKGTVLGVGPDSLRALVEKLAQQGVEIPLDRGEADVLLLTTAVEILLFPDALAATARILNRLGANWTLLSDAFEATNLGLVSGDESTQQKATARIVEHAEACGAQIGRAHV